ncbi:MAG: hypothetical protein LBT05_11800 [Planctomycetaceae bacterium]|jgi:hypothetical protein|nr:hypothetical protein [Planctomycetaceae bacterium]
MIDRNARNRLLQTIEDYMDEKISPEQFDVILHEKIAEKTEDEAIHEIREWLWDSWEDIGTNRLQSECHYWKLFNRIRLILTSDVEYQYEPVKHKFPFARFLGMSAITVFLCGSIFIFINCFDVLFPMIGLYVLCGVCYSVIWFLVFAIEKIFSTKPKPIQIYATFPFDAFHELMELRRSVPTFCSKRFLRKSPIKKPEHVVVKFLKRNALIRFLIETKCPAWVDKIGDGFVLFVGYIYTFFLITSFWIFITLFFSLFGGSQRKSRFVITNEKRQRGKTETEFCRKQNDKF